MAMAVLTTSIMIIDLAQDLIPVLCGQGGIDPSGDGVVGMNPFASQFANDLLAEGAKAHGLHRKFRICLDDPDHVPDGWICIKPQKKVRSCQFKEMHRMGLDDLSHVHQFPQESGRSGGVTPITRSQALAALRWWLTGQIPQILGVI